MDAKDIATQVSEILLEFMKTGPLSDDHANNVMDAVTDHVAGSIVNVSEAVDLYRHVCDKFMEDVISSKGIPLRSVTGSEALPNTDRRFASDMPDPLLLQIQDRYQFCLENFQIQAEKAFDDEITAFREGVAKFLHLVPVGGSKDKVLKANISDIKKTARWLPKWHKLLFTYKAASFPEEIEFLFIRQSGPIAAAWRFSVLDVECDFRMNHDHRALSGTIYLVRDSWAMEKGYLDKDSAPCIEDVVRPKQDIGCMCNLTWLYGLRDLPSHMLSTYGQKVFEQTRVR